MMSIYTLPYDNKHLLTDLAADNADPKEVRILGGILLMDPTDVPAKSNGYDLQILG